MDLSHESQARLVVTHHHTGERLSSTSRSRFPATTGRPDAEEQSVALITIHASKGLEWPIVIPINMTSAPKAESGLMHDRRYDRFSIPVFGVVPPDYGDIKAWNVAELGRERVRLWYVAATRARDLLILPRHSSVLNERAYARIVDFDLRSLATIDPEALGDPMPPPPAPPENQQTKDHFTEEAEIIFRLPRRSGWTPAGAGRWRPPRWKVSLFSAAPFLVDR